MTLDINRPASNVPLRGHLWPKVPWVASDSMYLSAVSRGHALPRVFCLPQKLVIQGSPRTHHGCDPETHFTKAFLKCQTFSELRIYFCSALVSNPLSSKHSTGDAPPAFCNTFHSGAPMDAFHILRAKAVDKNSWSSRTGTHPNRAWIFYV